MSPRNPYYEVDYAGFFEDDEDDENEGRCFSCGGSFEHGYDDCEFLGVPCYEPGPHDSEGRQGCPRMTGTF